MNFREWITDKYVTWRGNAIGNERSITDFAEYVGVSQPLMTKWMSGSIPRSQDKIAKLAAVFGPEIYKILGITPPDDPLAELLTAYYSLPPERREAFVRRFRDQISDLED